MYFRRNSQRRLDSTNSLQEVSVEQRQVFCNFNLALGRRTSSNIFIYTHWDMDMYWGWLENQKVAHVVEHQKAFYASKVLPFYTSWKP